MRSSAEAQTEAPRLPSRRGPRRLPSPHAARDRGRPRSPRTPLSGRPVELPRTLRDAVERLSQRLRGDYHEDEWGFDEQFAEAVYPLFEFLYDTWWRVEADGVRHVPSHGRALLVSNHAGSLFPFDASMILGAIMKEHPLPRWARFLVLDWAFVLPFISTFMRRVGGVPASPHNAARLLEQDELVMAFPEGAKGTGKPFSERYRLQRFGRGGFVEVALRTGAPIVPVAVVGAEEIYPKLADAKPLARAIGAPFVPITPTFPWLGPLGLIPLPSRWRIEFCEPVDLSEHGADAADDQRLLFDISEQVQGDDPGEAVREPGQARLDLRVGRPGGRVAARHPDVGHDELAIESGPRMSRSGPRRGDATRPPLPTVGARRECANRLQRAWGPWRQRAAEAAPRPSSGSSSTRCSPSWTPTRSPARCCAPPACGCASNSRTSGWC